MIKKANQIKHFYWNLPKLLLFFFIKLGCALKGYPGVYARVSVFADWIQTKLGEKYTPSEADEFYMDVEAEMPILPMDPAVPISKPILPMASRIVPLAPVWPYYNPYNFYQKMTFKPYMRPIYPNIFY